jgi:hypothetical protein
MGAVEHVEAASTAVGTRGGSKGVISIRPYMWSGRYTPWGIAGAAWAREDHSSTDT